MATELLLNYCMHCKLKLLMTCTMSTSFKVPLTCKLFISLKESVLLVKKIRGSFKCIWSLHWGEIEGQSFKNVLLFNR